MNDKTGWIETDSGKAAWEAFRKLVDDGVGWPPRQPARDQPTEVRREYMPQEPKRSPLFMATGMHVSELWLDSQGGAAA